MPRQITGNPEITLIGAGTLASALAPALARAGHRIQEIVCRPGPQSLRRARVLARRVGGRATTMDKAKLSAELIWVCVPDDAIAKVAASLALRSGWSAKTVLHSSGALGSDVLVPLKRAGAETASAHPLMTFVSASVPEFRGVPFALEGDPKALTVAAALVRSVGGKPFRIKPEHKAAYHAFGFFSSPLLVALIAAAQQVGQLAGANQQQSRELMEPIVRQTIENCFRETPQAAFSGPLRRGDVQTIRKHLKVLADRPDLLAVYRALSQVALKRLPVGNARLLERLLR